MNLRNNLLKIALPALVITLTVFAFITCENFGSKGHKALTLEEREWYDTITYKESGATLHYEVDWPTEGEEHLVHNLREWINSFFGAQATPEELATGSFIPASIHKLMTDDSLMMAKMYEPEWATIYEHNLCIHQLTDTLNFVTFTSMSYDYTGGAHGSTGYQGATFRRTDGRCFSKPADFFTPDSFEKILEMAYNALDEQYFYEMEDSLRLDDVMFETIYGKRLSMPGVAYFTPDGVMMQYQQYEIAPYAYGAPECVLPYKEVLPYLTTAARSLLEP